ncbi:MAG: N-terminal acetyltransferase [Caeruleum heppii]|nr:MAG: N-terminal acetyltransferase [Caeruleum heppii]
MAHQKLSERPLYTSSQIERYFTHISFPQGAIRHEDTRTAQGLTYLTALQKHHMVRVPFESLSLHYSKHHIVSIDPSDLYHKIVDKGHGGYCMENNTFFGSVLRSLGFDIYSVGARVSHAINGSGEGYGGWSHMVNIVMIDGQKFMVDVGFGSGGPTHPLPLKDGGLHEAIAPQMHRLLWTNISQNTDPSQRLWVFEARNGDHEPWRPNYCFSELEMGPTDYNIMNFFTSTSRTSIFTYTVICTKTILEGDTVVGNIVLVGNEVKRRLCGKSEHLQTCDTEQQRVEALARWFDIRLTTDEQHGIRGMTTQLKG